MSIVPSLAGMPAPDNSDAGHVAQIKEVGDGVLITMSDGREIKVKPGDDIDIRPITRDTQVVTQGDPSPQNFRDLHNAGKLPDMIAAMLAPRPQVLDPTAAPSLAGITPGAGGNTPMLPDMADALGAANGGPPGAPPGGAPGGLPPDMNVAPGTPMPDDSGGPLGMPPGSPSSGGPPGIPGMPPGMPGNLPNIPTLPGMPPPGMMRPPQQ